MSCGFSNRELSANKEVLGELAKKENWQEIITRIVKFARAKDNPKRYIIGSLKKELKMK